MSWVSVEAAEGVTAIGIRGGGFAERERKPLRETVQTRICWIYGDNCCIRYKMVPSRVNNKNFGVGTVVLVARQSQDRGESRGTQLVVGGCWFRRRES